VEEEGPEEAKGTAIIANKRGTMDVEGCVESAYPL